MKRITRLATGQTTLGSAQSESGTLSVRGGSVLGSFSASVLPPMKGIILKWDKSSKGGDGRHFDFSSGQWCERPFAAAREQGERRSFADCYAMIERIHPNHKPTHIMLWQPGSSLHGAIGEVGSGALKMVFKLFSATPAS